MDVRPLGVRFKRQDKASAREDDEQYGQKNEVEPTVRKDFPGAPKCVSQHDAYPAEVEQSKQASSAKRPKHWEGDDSKVEQVMGDEVPPTGR